MVFRCLGIASAQPFCSGGLSWERERKAFHPAPPSCDLLETGFCVFPPEAPCLGRLADTDLEKHPKRPGTRHLMKWYVLPNTFSPHGDLATVGGFLEVRKEMFRVPLFRKVSALPQASQTNYPYMAQVVTGCKYTERHFKEC